MAAGSRDKNHEKKCIGIIGGYGAIGATVTSELLKNSDHSIRIGGRNPNKINACIDALGNHITGRGTAFENNEPFIISFIVGAGLCACPLFAR